LRLHGHDLRFLSAKSRAVFRCIACAAALTPPPAPPSQGGENLRRLVFFPPLRRGDTGGCFECLCAVPGSSSTRLKIALASGEGSAQGLNPLVLASWSVGRGALSPSLRLHWPLFAGSGSGLLTRPSSATAALNRRRVTWR